MKVSFTDDYPKDDSDKKDKDVETLDNELDDTDSSDNESNTSDNDEDVGNTEDAGDIEDGEDIEDEILSDVSGFSEDDIQNINLNDSQDTTEFSEKDYVIEKIYNIFIRKYSHLDNTKNKKLIYEMCKMTINSMPEHLEKPQIYLNFMESSIKDIINQSKQNDDFFN